MSNMSNIDVGDLAAFEKMALKALRAQARSETRAAPFGRLRRNGMDYAEHRPYRAGDDIRRIDWRTSQRLGQTYVRQFDAEANADWIICLDCSASMSIDQASKWKLGLQLAEAFAYLCLITGQGFGLRVFSNKLDLACPLGRGHAHFATLVALLGDASVVRQGGTTHFEPCYSGTHHGTAFIIISDFLSAESLVQELDLLVQISSNTQLIQITSPRECVLPPKGVRSVQDVETGRNVSIEAQGAEHHAQARLALLQSDLLDYCLEQNIFLTQCQSNEAWRHVVARHLENVLGVARGQRVATDDHA